MIINQTLLLNNITLFTDLPDVNIFYSTLASSSTVFIIVICTFSIYLTSSISENIQKKKSEIDEYIFKIYNYEKENVKINEKIKELIGPRNIIQDADLNKYRQYSQIVMENNLYKEDIKKKILTNKKYIRCITEHRICIIEKRKYLSVYSILFIISPLSFLAFSTNNIVLLISNILKIPFIVIFLYFIIKILRIGISILKTDSLC